MVGRAGRERACVVRSSPGRQVMAVPALRARQARSRACRRTARHASRNFRRFAERLEPVLGVRPDLPDLAALFEAALPARGRRAPPGGRRRAPVAVAERGHGTAGGADEHPGSHGGTRRVPVRLVLCGSYIGQMESLLSESSPLRGRLTPLRISASALRRRQPVHAGRARCPRTGRALRRGRRHGHVPRRARPRRLARRSRASGGTQRSRQAVQRPARGPRRGATHTRGLLLAAGGARFRATFARRSRQRTGSRKRVALAVLEPPERDGDRPRHLPRHWRRRA